MAPPAKAGMQHPSAQDAIPQTDEPIGASDRELPPSSWKANHDRSHVREAASGEGKAARNSAGALEVNARDIDSRERASAVELASDRRRAVKPKPPVDTKPKPARAPSKRAAESIQVADSEVDFGI
jgi:hypothetical protein